MAMTGTDIDRHRGRAIGFAYFVAFTNALVYILVLAGVSLPFGWRTGLDAFLFVILAWGIGRNSRLAACALCAYWFLTKAALWFEFHRISVLLGLVVVGYFFVQGARAVFAAHRNRLAVERIAPAS